MAREAVAAERRRRILEVAARLFAERGYTATSTDHIAAAAGASKETLYAYFGDKAGLLREVLASLVAVPDTGSDGEQSVDPITPRRFEAMLQRLAADLVADLMQPSYLAVARIVVAETPRDPSLADLFREAVPNRALSRVSSLLRAGQRNGLVDPHLEVATATRAFVGPLLTYVLLDGLLRAPGDVHAPDRTALRRQVALFHRAVQAPTRSKESP